MKYAIYLLSVVMFVFAIVLAIDIVRLQMFDKGATGYAASALVALMLFASFGFFYLGRKSYKIAP